jgi:hypothetical protein
LISQDLPRIIFLKKVTFRASAAQGCQMVRFQPKNYDLGKFLGALEWKTLVFFMAIWNILLSFGIFYGHLVMLW